MTTLPVTQSNKVVTEPRIEITPKCVKSVTKVNSADTCQGEVIFEENFDDNVINTNKWLLENRFSLDVEVGVIIPQMQQNLCYIAISR